MKEKGTDEGQTGTDSPPTFLPGDNSPNHRSSFAPQAKDKPRKQRRTRFSKRAIIKTGGKVYEIIASEKGPVTLVSSAHVDSLTNPMLDPAEAFYHKSVLEMNRRLSSIDNTLSTIDDLLTRIRARSARAISTSEGS